MLSLEALAIERRLSAILAADIAGYSRLHMAHAGLAAVYGQLGETEKARAVLADILARHPKFADDPRAAFVTRRMPRDLVEALMDGLRKAGRQVPPAGA